MGDKVNKSGGLMNFQLSLTEYSAKYKVSISTLRRRIKKRELLYVQEAGKYILPDIPYDKLLGDSIAHPTRSVTDRGPDIVPSQKTNQAAVVSPLESLGLDLSFKKEKNNKPFSQTTNEVKSKALMELKKAYTLVLSEKEEQILQLRQHISDLQTLNKAFENEIHRLEQKNLTGLKTSFIKHAF